MKKLALFIFLGFAGMILIAGLTGKSVFAPWSFVKGTKQVEGQYYRLLAEFTYKGEPVKIDFINACGGNITIYKDNSRPEDIFGGAQVYNFQRVTV